MKKKQIKYTMARALLSDTLPYEIPLTFSNRHFYQFVNEFNIQFVNDKSNTQSITCNLSDNTFEIILKLLFGTSKPLMGKKINIDDKMHRRVPFVFNIAHKANRFRELAIPHPKSQLELVAFYDVYKELILYYSNISSFSIRKPDKIAKFIYQNDNLHKMNLGDEDDAIESSDREYENLKTFFTYSQYPHIYKFYEDYRYHRAEKKYDKLFKFDISKCFDSIYTHSIGWAVNSKEYAKEYCSSNAAEFGNRFDKFMQNTNYGETNGIVIGPEFSRVFAEIILQKIDKTVEQRLKTRKENKLTFKRDYEIFRYVDDYFVFYNDDKVKEDILTEYELLLKTYKMSISESKSIHYVKPLITELTIAKDKITDLIDNEIFLKIEKKDSKERICDFQINCNSKSLITKFKTIIKESNVEYKDVMNFTLYLYIKKSNKVLVDMKPM
ncbi:MAG: RNA-directed DNA polymerase [Paludibacter sp.]|nr:RNA-directed DNA polymerase [Paludibacter sp.]